MKKTVCGIVMIGCYSIMLHSAWAFEFGVDLPVNSKYMWRGLELNEDPVFQPDVWISYKGFNLTVWGNMELTSIYNGHGENGDPGDFTEVDYTLKYEGDFDKLNYSLGYIYYDYPHTAYDSTYELFGSIGYDVLLSPTLTVYRDLKEADGWYMSLGISHEVALPRVLNSTLTLSGAIGFSSENHTELYYGEGSNTCTDSLVSAALEIPVTGNIAIIPSVNYSALLGSVRDKHLNKRDDAFWCGVNVAFSFAAGK